MRFFIILALLCMATLTAADKLPERMDLDPVLQGVWKLHLTSTDGGKTVKKATGAVFARASATKFKMVGVEEELKFKKILIIKDDAGNPGNAVLMNTGAIWFIFKKDNDPNVLVRCFPKGDTKKEGIRLVVTVHK